MASRAEAQAVLDDLAKLREQVEALDDPARTSMLGVLKLARTEAEAVLARAVNEEKRAARGVGAAPRYGRMR